MAGGSRPRALRVGAPRGPLPSQRPKASPAGRRPWPGTAPASTQRDRGPYAGWAGPSARRIATSPVGPRHSAGPSRASWNANGTRPPEHRPGHVQPKQPAGPAPLQRAAGMGTPRGPLRHHALHLRHDGQRAGTRAGRTRAGPGWRRAARRRPGWGAAGGAAAAGVEAGPGLLYHTTILPTAEFRAPLAPPRHAAHPRGRATTPRRRPPRLDARTLINVEAERQLRHRASRRASRRPPVYRREGMLSSVGLPMQRAAAPAPADRDRVGRRHGNQRARARLGTPSATPRRGGAGSMLQQQRRAQASLGQYVQA